jgi:hypothetical protein
MNDNRYSPPGAQVADINLAQGTAGPSLLNVAALLLVGTIASGFVSSALQWQYLRSQATVGFIVFGGASTTILISWLSYKIWKGRNWARILMLVLFIAGMPLSYPQLPIVFARSPAAAFIFVFQTIAQASALYIVFLTSAKQCFRKAADMPNNALQATRKDARA